MILLIITVRANVTAGKKRSCDGVPGARGICFCNQDSILRLPAEQSEVSEKIQIAGMLYSLFVLLEINYSVRKKKVEGDIKRTLVATIVIPMEIFAQHDKVLCCMFLLVILEMASHKTWQNTKRGYLRSFN